MEATARYQPTPAGRALWLGLLAFGAVTTSRHLSIAKTAMLKRMKKRLGFASRLKKSFTPVPRSSERRAPSRRPRHSRA